MQIIKAIRPIAGAFVLGALLTACGDSDDSSSGATVSTDGGDSGSGIEVSLSEWAVEAPTTASAGSVEITATNDGGETHELVVVRAESTDDFVIDEETGKVDEDGFAEGDLIGEIAEFEAGTSASATFDLDAGTYVFFCNIVEEDSDGTFESHFQKGMVSTITVE